MFLLFFLDPRLFDHSLLQPLCLLSFSDLLVLLQPCYLSNLMDVFKSESFLLSLSLLLLLGFPGLFSLPLVLLIQLSRFFSFSLQFLL